MKEFNISKLSQKEIQEQEDEMTIVKGIFHPNLQPIRDFYITYQGYMCTVVDHCNEGTLVNHLRQNSDPISEAQLM